MPENEHIKNNKLIIVLSSISKEELKQFKKFVYSPYHNENIQVRRLLDYLVKWYPDFEQKRITYEQIFKAINPESNNTKEFVIKLCSRLFKCLENYLAIHAKQADSLAKQTKEIKKLLQLLRYYNENHLDGLFKQTLKRLDKALEEYPYRNEYYFNFQHLREVVYCGFLSAKQERGTGDVNLQELNNRLDEYYFIYKMKLFSLMINRQQVVPHPYDKTLFSVIRSSVLTNTENRAVFEVWRKVIEVLEEPGNKGNYDKLKLLLKKNNHLLNPEDARNFYVYLGNMLVNLPAGSDAFYTEYFKLYEQQLETGLIYVNGLITPVVFQNIFTLALRLRKLDWAHQFLENHKDKIAPEYLEKEDIYTLCLASYNFELKQFEEALSKLNQIGFISVHTKLQEKRIRLRVYYELDMILLLDGLINSFRKFLSENKTKIHPYHIEGNRKFINFVFALSNLQEGKAKKIHSIKDQIENTRNLPGRNWLLEKADNIDKRRTKNPA